MSDTFRLAVTGQSLIKHDTRGIDIPAFQQVQEVLRQADLAFTNFEGTILGRHGGWPLKGSFFGSSGPVVLDALRSMGFQALSLSNNHAFDLGPSGVLSTLEEVEQRGFLHAGLGRNHTEAARAATGTFGGRRVAIVAMDGGPGPDFMYATDGTDSRPERPGVNRLRLTQVIEVDDEAFRRLNDLREKVGYTTMDLTNDSQPDDPPHIELEAEMGIARAIFRRSDRFGRGVRVDKKDMARNLAAITSAAQEGCLVIAYLHHHHWASDWYQVPDWGGSIAKQCIDAGASMFLSHGAPVLQPVEIYRGRPIFYSLGNFVFHVRSEGSLWTASEIWQSVIGSCQFDSRNELVDMTFVPIVIAAGKASADGRSGDLLVPQRATGKVAEEILHRFSEQSRQVGTNITVSDGIGSVKLG
ncbi:capsule biosynthesis protein CapA (plasmid) [Rhizobium sp. ACO-34A]|nr:CapA family protein [Rhizobium sp. ACO-34A]ATN36819.1 capsule biosynthesis protein CapA [Rhizobium sp. ACO-34A]